MPPRSAYVWQDGQFDVLLQEAQRCDGTLSKSFKRSSNSSEDHLVRVFTKLMLQGNVRAAMRWITERTGGGLLNPTQSVVDALKSKHPEPQVPPDSALPHSETFPFMEDVEITAAHVQFVAGRLQGGACPGGCQSVHWRDALLRHGSASARLREAVASLCRLLCNSVVPWDNIRALLASRLIALDKCPRDQSCKTSRHFFLVPSYVCTMITSNCYCIL